MNLETTGTTGQPTTPSWKRLDIETVATLVATGVVGLLLFLCAVYAGPLWRDETNTINVALMPLKELWSNLPFESFPPLWLLVVRGWSLLGMAGSDGGIRLLSFFVGLSFLGSIWLCARWIGCRAPTLIIALLATIPAFLFTMSSNRAYGLAMCLLVLTFGTIWRLLERPTRSRLLAAGAASLLFVHCVYYDAIFLCGILSGAAAVSVRRRHWMTLLQLLGIGAAGGATMLIYLPVIRTGSVYAPLMQTPFSFSRLWAKLADAVSQTGSALPEGAGGSTLWVWIALTAMAAFLGITLQFRFQSVPESATEGIPRRTDLALFSILSLLFGTVAYTGFLFILQFPTHAWYYMVLFTLCALCLEAMLAAGLRALNPWGTLRISLLVLLGAFGFRSTWQEAHTRRSNVDIIAAILNEKAREGDLIVVQFAFEAITFDRYYHGKASWASIPPIESHKVHRSDLIWQKMTQGPTMQPVLAQAETALKNGGSVWVVGHIDLVHSGNLPASPAQPTAPSLRCLSQYAHYWGAQLSAWLLDHAIETHTLTTTLNQPINLFEDLPLLHFSGYKPETLPGRSEAPGKATRPDQAAAW